MTAQRVIEACACSSRKSGRYGMMAPKPAQTTNSDTLITPSWTQPARGMPRAGWVQLGVISVSEFVVWAGFGAIIPYLPLFLEEQAHASMTLWAVIAAMFYVGTLLFSSPLGWLSDTI